MKKIFEKISNSSKKSRVLAAGLAAVVCVTSIWHGFGNKPVNVNAETATPESDKAYIEFIIDRMIGGLQTDFTILEIVPQTAQGEFRYYVGDEAVNDGLEARQDLCEQIFRGEGFWKDGSGNWAGPYGVEIYDTPYTFATTYSNFGYQIKLNSSTGLFEISCEKRFVNYVLPEYKDIFEGHIVTKTVEANDVTTDMVKEADFIILTTGTHDDATLRCYDRYTGNDQGVESVPDDGNGKRNVDSIATKGYNTYIKTVVDGVTTYTETTAATDINTNTYEKVVVDGEEKYISRDMSWDVAKLLLDYSKNGKKVKLSDGTEQIMNIPIIMDNQKYNDLVTDGNMYKMLYMMKFLNTTQYNEIINYFGEPVINSEGILSPELDASKVDKNNIYGNKINLDNHVGFDNKVKELFGYDNLTNKGGQSNFLTDFYWLYNGNSCLIPSNMTTVAASADSEWYKFGFTDRVGNEATAIDIMRYLLGAKDFPIIQLRNFDKLRILEIQPCNDFYYNTCEEVRALGQMLYLDIDGTLTVKHADGTTLPLYDKITDENFDDPSANICIQVDCMTSSAFNGINKDLLAEYDVIVMGTNDSMLLKDGEGGKTGKTIYNDKNLDGYVYLAYGDLIKAKSGISMYYPDDFTEYTHNQINTLEGNSSAAYHLEKGYWDAANTDPEAEGKDAYKNIIGVIANNRTGNNGTEYRKVYQFNAYTSKIWSPYLASNFTNERYYLLTRVEDEVAALKNAGKFNDLYVDNTGNIRLSGNDITALKLEQLKEYVKVGKLVVLDQNMYENNSSIIFPTSNVAKIADYIKNDATANKLQYETINTSLLLHLKNKNPVLNFSVTPTEIEYTDGKVSTWNAQGTNLPFKFTITGKANTNYAVNIYGDKNNDGVFNKDIVDNDRNELYADTVIPLNAYGNAEVAVTAKLSENYNGVINYKVEVIELDAAGNELSYRAAKFGYTYVKGEDTKDVKVLQITPIRTNNNVVINGDDYDTLDMSGQSTADGGTGTRFQALLDATEELIGYNIDVETMTTYEYESLFETNPYDISTPNVNDALAIYDMVVIGFGDLYGGDDITNEKGALDCITHFINSNKAVLFTHDTISYSPAPNAFYKYYEWGNDTVSLYTWHNSVNSWGKELSATFRDMVGMDRYGISTPEFDGTYDGEHSVYGLQGINNMLAYRHSIADTEYANYSATRLDNAFYLLYPYNTSIEAGGDSASYGALRATTKVEKINSGQVTMFPYYITDELTVASTHAQWYQLDMEDDEIVVWYTLSDDGSVSSQYYGDTDRDAGNNYYIYSKGNITYSGAGHSDMNSEEELKLFVNTIIKAITAGNNVPEVKVLESSFTGGYNNVYKTLGSGDYSFTFYGKDLDLRPEVGRFKSAKVTLTNINATEDYNGDGVIDGDDDPCLDYGNTLVSEIRTTVPIVKGGAGVFDKYADQIEVLIESGVGAQFTIELTDMYGDVGQANVKLVKKDLFDID